MANGILVGPVCVLLGLIAGARWTIIGAISSFTLVLVVLYFTGFVPGEQQQSFAVAVSHSLVLLRYVVTYLGNIINVANIRVAGFVGTLGLAASFASFLAVVWERGRHRSRLILFGVAAFVVATAMVTAFGRSGLGVSQALEIRYTTPTFVFWVAELTFWWSLIADSRKSFVARAAVILMATTIVGCAIKGEIVGTHDVLHQARISREAADSLLSAMFDPEAFSYDNEDQAVIQDRTAFLKEQHLSIFAAPEALLLRRPLRQAGEIVSEQLCTGRIDRVLVDSALGPGGLRVFGEATRMGSRGGVNRIYLVDQALTIVGYASGNQPDAVHRIWQGYAIGTGQSGSTINAYALLDPGHLCKLANGVLPAGMTKAP